MFLNALNPLNWVRWIFLFLCAWFLAISWRDIPKAIPALILIFVLVVTGTIAWNDNSNWRTELLDNQLAVAWEQESYDTAELVIKRQLVRRPSDTSLVYRLGLAREFQDDLEGAAGIMRSLTAYKRYEPAARWLLKKEFIDKQSDQRSMWSSLDKEQKAEFGSILKLILDAAPDDFPVKQLYADYLMAVEKFPQALPILEDLSADQPMRGLQAAILSRRLGNDVSAERYAIRALNEVSRMSKEDPTNSVLSLAVAQNQIFLKRFAESIRTLQQGIERASDDDTRAQLRLVIGNAIVAWVTHEETLPEQDTLRVLKLLQAGLRYTPNHPRILAMVADQAIATVDNDDEQIAAIRQALISGSDAGIAHFIRGTAALMKDDVESATMSLKLAAEHMPRSSVILNNLAVALASREDPDLEQALLISETAISQSANPSPHFFETRGQILFQMNRYLDAIPDLERSLKAKTLAKKAHQALATCYEKLGEEDLSALHRDAFSKWEE